MANLPRKSPPKPPKPGSIQPEGQTSLFRRDGAARDFRKPAQAANRRPTLDPVNQRSRVQATPPRQPAGGTGPNRQSPGQLSLRINGNNSNPFSSFNPIRTAANIVSQARSLASPVGAAIAVSAPRPTADGTLKAAQQRGDYRPKQGPINPDQGKTKAQSFDDAFRKARKNKQKEFDWNGNRYNTRLR